MNSASRSFWVVTVSGLHFQGAAVVCLAKASFEGLLGSPEGSPWAAWGCEGVTPFCHLGSLESRVGFSFHPCPCGCDSCLVCFRVFPRWWSEYTRCLFQVTALGSGPAQGSRLDLHQFRKSFSVYGVVWDPHRWEAEQHPPSDNPARQDGSHRLWQRARKQRLWAA